MRVTGIVKSAKATKAISWLVVLIGFALFLGLGFGGFLLIRSGEVPLFLLLFVAIAWALGSFFLLFYVMQRLTDVLPPKIARIVTPFIFIAPVIILISWTLLVPMVRTIIDSLFEFNAAANPTQFVGAENYAEILTDGDTLLPFRNNAFWIVVGTPVGLILGMLFAVLADGRRIERLFKTILFMPLTISLVGASVIWALVYQLEAEGATQTGVLNALVVAFGGSPQSWLQGLAPWNNLFLLVIAIWGGTGISVVFLSAALRGIPRDLIEAARVDGANEVRIFFSVQLPYIWPVVLAMITTSVIANLKIFDVIWVLTGGQFGTEVLATAFFRAQYQFFDFGVAAAYAVILLVLVVPVMIYNVRQFQLNDGISPGGKSMLRRMRERVIDASKLAKGKLRSS